MTVGALSLPSILHAQKEIPEPTNFLVNDYAGMLTRDQVVRLGEKLRNYVGETSTQIVVVTVESLEGEDPFDYSVRLGRAWGIGGGENDNGVLVFVAEQERQIRIQTGYGAEGFLPDAIANRIIEEIMVPAFRSGNFYKGIDDATGAIMAYGRGEYEGTGLPSNRRDGGIPNFVIILLIIIAIVVITSLFSRGDDGDDGGYWRGGRYDMGHGRRRRRGGGWIFLPGPWWGGGGSWGGGSGGGGGDGWGGFGGGGFGGFGGGDFGGGGAGGSW